jgi:ribosomal protein S20
MRRIVLTVSPVLLLLSSTAAIAEPQCAYASATIPSSDRRARHLQQNRLENTAGGEICRVYIKHFVEAVTARKDAASCQDGVARQRALEDIDAEIRAYNNRIAENSCAQ